MQEGPLVILDVHAAYFDLRFSVVLANLRRETA
jgi:hypothetical protein